MIEIYKSISQLNPQFMWSFFTHKDIPYNLRKGPILGLPKTHSFYYGTNAIHFRGSLIWNNLPAVVKSSNSLFEFKNKIKNIGAIDCRCLICQGYIIYVVFYFVIWLEFISKSYFYVPTVNKVLINK